MKLLQSGNAMYDPEKAAQMVGALRAGEDGWTYTIVNPAGPYTAIAIHDEDGEFIGNF